MQNLEMVNMNFPEDGSEPSLTSEEEKNLRILATVIIIGMIASGVLIWWYFFS